MVEISDTNIQFHALTISGLGPTSAMLRAFLFARSQLIITGTMRRQKEEWVRKGFAVKKTERMQLNFLGMCQWFLMHVGVGEFLQMECTKRVSEILLAENNKFPLRLVCLNGEMASMFDANVVTGNFQSPFLCEQTEIMRTVKSEWSALLRKRSSNSMVIGALC
ncbi:hypothetical protein SUGI_0514090 [Cryptomeria japonica]|nr:hypothetical protein SUGI_0514090 [Cryptomeria japonica]